MSNKEWEIKMRRIRAQQESDFLRSQTFSYELRRMYKCLTWDIKTFFRRLRRKLFGLNDFELEQQRQKKMCKG